MSNNFKHTRTWRDLLDEIPSIQWQKIAREPKPDTDYLIFKKLNKTLPLHRNNLVFKEVLPPNPRPPLVRGQLICLAVNSHPKPLELNYSLAGMGSSDDNIKTTIKLIIDYRVDDAIKLITEFDDALSEIEEYYEDALKQIFNNQDEFSSIKNEIAAIEVSQFGIFVEKVSVSNALEPKSVEEKQSIGEKQRIAELEMALYTEEQNSLKLKQRIAELENAFKIKEEALTKEAERLAELEKRLQLKQSNQEKPEKLAPEPELEPPWLNNKLPKEEPELFTPIAVDREIDSYEFEPIDYSENDKYDSQIKPSRIKAIIFILMVIIAIGAVVLYFPAIVALIKSLMEIG